MALQGIVFDSEYLKVFPKAHEMRDASQADLITEATKQVMANQSEPIYLSRNFYSDLKGKKALLVYWSVQKNRIVTIFYEHLSDVIPKNLLKKVDECVDREIPLMKKLVCLLRDIDDALEEQEEIPEWKNELWSNARKVYVACGANHYLKRAMCTDGNRMVKRKSLNGFEYSEDEIRRIEECRGIKYIDFGEFVSYTTPKGHKKVVIVQKEYKQDFFQLLNSLKGNPISREKAIEYLRKCAEALRDLHAKGLIHLDVRPENILDDEGNPVIIDPDFLDESPTRPEIKQFTCGQDDYSPFNGTLLLSKVESELIDVYGLALTILKLYYDLAVEPKEVPSIANNLMDSEDPFDRLLGRALTWNPCVLLSADALLDELSEIELNQSKKALSV